MKDIELKLLSELLKNSRRSDREMAKTIGVSQPTITRVRAKLEKEKYIREYTMIPDLIRMGYEVMAITVAQAKVTLEPKEIEKAKKLVLENPNVIFVAAAEGMGGNGVMISIHKSFSDYSKFITNLRLKSNGFMEKVDSMLVSLHSSEIVKPLSLRYLAQQMGK